MTGLWVAWFALFFGAFGVLEARAFLDRRSGTTLSANVWVARRHTWFRLLLLPGVVWLLHHLFNPWDDPPSGWDDLITIVVGAVLALVIRYKPRSGA